LEQIKITILTWRQSNGNQRYDRWPIRVSSWYTET
jgi:hypothetical protein